WKGLNRAGAGGSLYFRANEGVHGAELWTSDGTADGTALVKDINPGAADGRPGVIAPQRLVDVGGIAYFSATTTGAGSELWRSDGTEAGTTLVKDINPGAGGSGPTTPVPVHQALLVFSAPQPPPGPEAWGGGRPASRAPP